MDGQAVPSPQFVWRLKNLKIWLGTVWLPTLQSWSRTERLFVSKFKKMACGTKIRKQLKPENSWQLCREVNKGIIKEKSENQTNL